MIRAKRFFILVVLGLLATMRGVHARDPFDIPASTPPRQIGAEYFGTHFHRLLPARGQNAFTEWPTATIGTIRLWDSYTRWADIEPRPGEFDFSRMDLYVAAAQARGASVMYVFGSPAPWASARPQEPGPYGPGSAAEPAEMAAWDRYVAAVVRRYKGRITHYELWNEPGFSDRAHDMQHVGKIFFSGSVAKLVELGQRARAVLDREDPQAKLISPGFDGDTARVSMYLAAGGGAFIDAMAYHFYVHSDAEFLDRRAVVRAAQARYGVGELPLFNTEAGFRSTGATAPEGAMLLARTMILGAFTGIERYYHYAWDNERLGMAGTAGGPAESRHREAFESVQRWLLGSTLLGCRRGQQQILVCEAQRKGQRIRIMWRPDGPPTSLWQPVGNENIVAAERAVAEEVPAYIAGDRGIVISRNPVAVITNQ